MKNIKATIVTIFIGKNNTIRFNFFLSIKNEKEKHVFYIENGEK